MAAQNLCSIDEEPPVLLENCEQGKINIHNVTVYGDYGICLDLNEVSSKFGNCLYIPKEFNCVRVDVRLNKHFNQGEISLDHMEIQQNRNELLHSSNNVSINDNLVTTSIFRKSKIGRVHGQSTNESNDDESYKTSIKVAIFSNGKVVTTGARSVVAAACGLEKVARALRRRVSKEVKVCFMIVTNILSVYSIGHPLRLNLFAKLCPGAIYEPDRFPAAQVKIPTKKPLYLFTAASIFCKNVNNSASQPLPATDDKNSNKNYPQDFLPQSVPIIISPSQNCNIISYTDSNKFQKTITGNAKKITSYRHSGKISLKNIGYFNKLKTSPTSFNSPSNSVSARSPTNNQQSEPSSQQYETLEIKGKSAWISDDVYDNLNEAVGVVGDGHAKGRGINKEEVVTVNVFSTGNITLTGARSISSIKYALSIISPYLSKSKSY